MPHPNDIFQGRLSKSGQVVTVYCPGCHEYHEHVADDAIRAGKLVEADAHCAEIISASTGKTEVNRSSWKGKKYFIKI